ncbi:hypothetical protein QJS10_CPA01g01522 [Acorus calamus]|uniref:Uncharacterized protein n=1 Tax=Acorus calamus TaxID=4465 RepID=A0AAV9FLD4_ACOCL|nr:hypothetical protein QJS10_CPA01g01522 [Acorus calamus]
MPDKPTRKEGPLPPSPSPSHIPGSAIPSRPIAPPASFPLVSLPLALARSGVISSHSSLKSPSSTSSQAGMPDLDLLPPGDGATVVLADGAPFSSVAAQSRIFAPRPKQNRVNVSSSHVNAVSKDWASLFNSSVTKQHHTGMEFFPLERDCSQKFAVLEEEEIKEAEAAWGFILVGYVWGKRPVFTPFLQFIKKLWKPKG